MNNVRPTFGVVDTSVNNDPKRPEMGAIWERISQRNSKFMSIKLKLSKEKLKALLEAEGDDVTVNLVAFSNKDKQENDKRPSYRIYEELTKKENISGQGSSD